MQSSAPQQQDLKSEIAPNTKLKFINANAASFIKSNDALLKVRDADMGESSHHSVNVFTKKPKTTVSQNIHQSGKRNQYEWYGITNDAIKPNMHHKLYPLLIFCGEVARLIGGNLAPKYRYDAKNKLLLSKGVEHPERLVDFQIRAWPPEFTIERTGTDILIHYLFNNNDLNSGNCLANTEKEVCVLIDYDRCFPNILYKYLHTDPFKVMTYDVGDHVKKYPDGDMFLLADIEKKYKDETYMGIMSVRDYDNLPFCKDQLATTWQFMNIYTSIDDKSDAGKNQKILYGIIAQAYRVVAEKHFAAIVSYLSVPLIYDLADIHIQDGNDNAEMKKEISERFDKKLEEILIESIGTYGETLFKSDGFKEFLEKNPLNMIKAALYHLHRFFMDNRHYQSNWLIICDEIISRYSNLWLKLFKKPLDVDVENTLKSYVIDVNRYDTKALVDAKDFYEKYHMNSLVHQVEDEIRFSNEKISKNPMSIFRNSTAVQMSGKGGKVQSGIVPIGSDLNCDIIRANAVKR
jgi:hypothetical protein